MNVLVIGFGSIGKRHVANLSKMDEIKAVYVLTGQKPQEGQDQKVHFLDPLDLKAPRKLSHFLLKQQIEFAVIANETSKHLATSLMIADAGIHLFIEKPLSHTLDGVTALSETAVRRGLKIFVGYNLRFLGVIRDLKEKLSRSIIGDLYFGRIEAGYSLALWRPDRDYRTMYSSSSAKGGGVALDLSHEVDYMRFLFGQPRSWKVMRTKASSLEIDTDDLFEGLYQFDNNFVCSVHMDYLQPCKKREIRIFGSKGSIVCDVAGNLLKTKAEDCGEVCVTDQRMFDIPGTYVDEMRHFVAVMKGMEEPCVTLDDGIKALKLLQDSHV